MREHNWMHTAARVAAPIALVILGPPVVAFFIIALLNLNVLLWRLVL